ncbi:MAG: T9SS C-terminal target domain-containing protein, partial [Bacteroidetes bacterium]
PFNPQTTITYVLNEASSVTLAVYDELGRRVRTLVQGQQAAGTYRVTWDATRATGGRVPSGLYFVRLEAGGQTVTRSMMLLK